MWASDATASRTGFESTSAPGGTTVEVCPPKVSSRRVPAANRAPEPWMAIDARPITSGRAPKLLLRRTRTIEPPALANAISRMV
jgi:hypothetical protein